MRHRNKAQSLVEMALILPLLLFIIFGIIDMSYYVFGYSTIYQATRNGSEVAAHFPPYPSKLSPTLDASDPCVRTILETIREDASQFSDIADQVQITYPGSRALGKQIEVHITYSIEPLTPLFQMVPFQNGGVMTVRTTSRRSIESLGDDPAYNQGIACQS